VIAVTCAAAWFLALPLRDLLAYPERLSVLPNLETDAAAYDAFAQAFAHSGRIADLPSKHPPGWMVLLAAVYATAGHSYVAGKLLSWGALIVAVGLCASLAARLYGRGAAAVAALLCASSPGLRWYVGTLQYEVVTGALFLALLVSATRIVDAAATRVVRRAAVAGVAGAALVLTRETFVLVIPIVALWIWSRLRRGGQRRYAATAALTLIATAAAPAILWSGAQTIQHQRLILISEKGPKEFQLGNNPLANGSYNEPLVGMGEPAGLAFIRAYPREALTLAGRKLLYLFGVLRDGWNVPHPSAVWIWRASTGALPLSVIEPVARGGWLLIACLVALAVMRREGWRTWWGLPASIAAILAVHVITLGSYRFAVPLLPALYALASGPMHAAVRAILPPTRTLALAVPAALIAGLIIAAQFRTWPLHASYEAAALDGLAARNVVDEVSHRSSRQADAARGIRPIVLLAEQYFPYGTMQVQAHGRRLTESAPPTAALRMAMTDLSGTVLCTIDVPAAALQQDRYSPFGMACPLAHDLVGTVAIFSLGTTDIAIDTLSLTWR
jgi:4-amino-4-deoxy-L-arabinose transferase-like glycosyltransferase